MVVRMRATKSHRNNRRSHHKLANPALTKCTNCEAMHLRHRMCVGCGMYRGRVVVKAKAEKVVPTAAEKGAAKVAQKSAPKKVKAKAAKKSK